MKELLDYNEKLCATPLMPPLVRDLVKYESLGANHYNVALRMGRDCTQSPAGDLSKLKELDASWASACAEGHLWIVLPSTLDESLKADISAWRNQDQNENQPITDGELIRLCSLSVEDFLIGVPGGKAVQMPLNQLVSSTCNRTPLRIGVNTY